MNPSNIDDVGFMSEAMAFAKCAESEGEVPVGAVVVLDGAIISGAGNRSINDNDPSAHAEIGALRKAGESLGNYRLPGTTLYVTLEPCAMCAAALVHARIQRLVFAAADPTRGAAGSSLDYFSLPGLNHRIEVTGGVLAEECGELLRAFFRQRR